MRVRVDSGRCQGHARCEAMSEEFFTLDEDGYSDIGDAKVVPAGLEDAVRRGIESCPEGALSEVPS